MELEFAEYYRQQDLSDADLVIRLSRVAAPPPRKRQRTRSAASQDDPLLVLPAHQIILSKCDFFKAQLKRWQDNNSPAAATAAAAAVSRPTLELTIDSVDQQPAAEAVIAAMYGVKAAMSNLQQQQLVHAAVIADRLQATAATQLAVDALLAAAESEGGLAAATLGVLASLYPWPSCLVPLLLPVIRSATVTAQGSAVRQLDTMLATDGEGKVQQLQRLLLAVLGDLDAVWADQQLRHTLLKLPLPAMQLLLKSDELCVVSEDTVLYTATQYVQRDVDSDDDDSDDEEAQFDTTVRTLAPLVRAPHLSRFALSCAVLGSSDEPSLLKCACAKSSSKLNILLSMAAARMSPAEITDLIRARLPGTPASWLLGPWKIKQQPGGVEVVWRLPVSELQKACRESAEKQRLVALCGPNSPPLGGLAWRLFVAAEPTTEDGNIRCSTIGVYAEPEYPPLDVSFKFTYTVISCTRHGEVFSRIKTTPWLLTGNAWGWPDFYELGPMAGGWDEAAWAAKGLPATGDLELQLTVHRVE